MRNRDWTLWAMEPQRRRRRDRVAWLLAAFGLLAALFAAAHARAGKAPVAVPLPVICMDPEEATRIVTEDFKERPVWTGETAAGGKVVVYQDGEAWTIVAYTGDTACFLASRSQPGKET